MIYLKLQVYAVMFVYTRLCLQEVDMVTTGTGFYYVAPHDLSEEDAHLQRVFVGHTELTFSSFLVMMDAGSLS